MRLIVIILIIYLLFTIIRRLILPFILRSMMKKAQQRFQDQFDQHHNRPEGDVQVEKGGKKKKNDKGDNEEYVDYEEVE